MLTHVKPLLPIFKNIPDTPVLTFYKEDSYALDVSRNNGLDWVVCHGTKPIWRYGRHGHVARLSSEPVARRAGYRWRRQRDGHAFHGITAHGHGPAYEDEPVAGAAAGRPGKG